jgi:hypothetical protein
MKKPRELRIPMKLFVRIWGMDAAGKLFGIDAHTVDITPVGACIHGPLAFLQRGAVVGVKCGRSHARFRVVWIGQPGTGRQGQIGVRCIEPGKYIWGVPLKRQMEVGWAEASAAS